MFTFVFDLVLIYPLVLLQGLQTLFYVFLSFDKQDTDNFMIDNIVLTFVTSLFYTFNFYLYIRLIENPYEQAGVSLGAILLLFAAVLLSNFRWEYSRDFDTIFLIIYLTIGVALMMVFGLI